MDQIMNLTKMEAARRQLDIGVALFCHASDPVAVHTLACAAGEIISDVAESRGIADRLIRNQFMTVVRPEHREFLHVKFREPQNFFKHADRDPDAILEYRPAANEFFLWEAAQDYQTVFGHVTPPMRAILAWFMTKHRDLYIQGELVMPGLQEHLESIA